ncbi:hypothetical protein FSP39_023819 [Pinctada imbricata]|uniref:Myb-like, SWIRM and MPN domain-containing protein 1 n=1 Tax=Pinctada imbricata TaxID=66713 RepID=A0AA89BY61_PINIB|nr:hypothetical protein FSP39_023819 [Pinctada imbricata]
MSRSAYSVYTEAKARLIDIKPLVDRITCMYSGTSNVVDKTTDNDIYDANELPSKSANLLPEYTNPAWMLEQGWTMDSGMDEKSKATIEKMLQEEQYYINGKGKGRVTRGGYIRKSPSKPQSHKQPWTEEEKLCFLRGLEIFGRSWTKVAELIPSRTVLQVKNYAQQYFKQKAKGDTDTEDLLLTDSCLHTLASKPRELNPNSVNSPKSPSQSNRNSVLSRQNASPKVATKNVKNMMNQKTVSSVSTLSRSVKKEAAFDPISEVLASVTTAQPTITTLRPSSAAVSMTLTQSIGQVSNSSLLAQLRSQVQQSKVNVLNSVDKVFDPSGDIVLASHASLNTFPDQKIVKTHSKKNSKPEILETMEIKWNLHKQSLDVEEDKKKLQLSPTLENKLASSTGIIENLDRFCAVADIITEGEDLEDDEEIDIENEDDVEENPVLQNRSASPNSVYEKLLKAANASKKTPIKRPVVHNTLCNNYKVVRNGISDEQCDDKSEENKKESKEVRENSDTGAVLDSTSHCSDTMSEEDWSTESNGSNGNEASQTCKPNNAIISHGGEIFEFPVPTKERFLQNKEITEEEKKIHTEFFDGRPSKTPERYLRIRNYIIDCWKKCQPSYLNKTSVRPGLKNCGDVNVIGRIHAYLECTGVINFGCEQCCYNNPSRPPSSGPRDRLPKENVQICMAKLESMRPRKRRIKDAYGQWIDEKEAQGKTIEHIEGAEETDDSIKQKVARHTKSNYDPFKLIPCLKFSEEKKAPFNVEVYNSALITMDLHAHVSKTEVIGLLGGVFCDKSHTLEVRMAVPCNSISTGMQCEMDPVSQTEACEKIMMKEYNVIGWYHSHPAFLPNPSVRDIETQLKFQEWFAKGGFPYIGIIISPYNRMNTGTVSEINCLTISHDKSSIDQCNIPYSFDHEVMIQAVDEVVILSQAHAIADRYYIPYSFDHEVMIQAVDEVVILSQARAIADRYCKYQHRVELQGMYRTSTGITCLGKMIDSLRHSMIADCDVSEFILNSIYQIFCSTFCGTDMEVVYEEEINSMEIVSSEAEHSNENLELGIAELDPSEQVITQDVLTGDSIITGDDSPEDDLTGDRIDTGERILDNTHNDSAIQGDSIQSGHNIFHGDNLSEDVLRGDKINTVDNAHEDNVICGDKIRTGDNVFHGDNIQTGDNVFHGGDIQTGDNVSCVFHGDDIQTGDQ